MARQNLNNLDLFGTQRTKINDNFTELYDLASRTLSTGLITFGGFGINADPTRYDIGAVKGYIIDSTVEPPTMEYIDRPAETGRLSPFTNTDNLTHVGIGAGGVVVEKNEPFTADEAATIIDLGLIGHLDQTVISVVVNRGAYIQSPTKQLHDLMRVFQPSVKGAKYSASGANLQLARSSGEIFGIGFGNANDITPAETPNTLELATEAVVPNMLLVASDDSFIAATGDNVDPTQYDPNGDINNLVAVSPSNRFTIQYIVVFPEGRTNIQYGQTLYSDMDTAKAALENEAYTVAPVIAENAFIRAALVVRGDCTDLSDPAQAFIKNFGKLGGEV